MICYYLKQTLNLIYFFANSVVYTTKEFIWAWNSLRQAVVSVSRPPLDGFNVQEHRLFINVGPKFGDDPSSTCWWNRKAVCLYWVLCNFYPSLGFHFRYWFSIAFLAKHQALCAVFRLCSEERYFRKWLCPFR